MKVNNINSISTELDTDDYKKIGIYWDKCYNFFYTHQTKESLLANKQLAYKQLNSFLSKFGMKKRRSYFVGYDEKDFDTIIDRVADRLDGFTFDFLEPSRLVDLYKAISESIMMGSKAPKDKKGKPKVPSNTAVTKVMLGIYGNIPAFDTRFIQTFHCISCQDGIVPRFDGKVNIHNLEIIKKFYKDNKNDIDIIAQRQIQCKHKGEIKYSISRLLDCYGWHKDAVEK